MKRLISSPRSLQVYRYPGHAIATSVINTLAAPPVVDPNDVTLLTDEQLTQLRQDINEYAADLLHVKFEKSKSIGPLICFGQGNHSLVFAHTDFPHILIKVKPTDFVSDEHLKYGVCTQIAAEESLILIRIPKTQIIPISHLDEKSRPSSALIQEKMNLVDRDNETEETLSMTLAILAQEYPSSHSSEIRK